MVEFEAETKKWGGSVGFVIPKEIVKEVGIKPNETVVIEIKRDIKQKNSLVY